MSYWTHELATLRIRHRQDNLWRKLILEKPTVFLPYEYIQSCSLVLRVEGNASVVPQVYVCGCSLSFFRAAQPAMWNVYFASMSSLAAKHTVQALRDTQNNKSASTLPSVSSLHSFGCLSAAGCHNTTFAEIKADFGQLANFSIMLAGFQSHGCRFVLQPRWGHWTSVCCTTRKTTPCTAPSTRPR